ncbi:MAG: DUF3237 domain-containing protein [Candidatus Acidiferrales bacterium]
MNRAKAALMAAILILTAVLCVGRVNAQGAKPDAKVAQANAPHLQFVFEEYVTLGAAIHPGATPYGDRNIVPITGGAFFGPKIRGKVMPEGWDWQLSTKSGCHSVHANYFLKADDGTVINIINAGTFCTGAGKNFKIFTTPKFEAPLGPHDWLNSGAYVGTLDLAKWQGKTAVRIRIYEVQ